jgi:GNAT superfamily N-acetyltransferase
MIDYSLIRLIPADDSHQEFGYQVKKSAEGAYIEQIWGWEENVQRDYYAREWEKGGQDIITYYDIPVGTIAVRKRGDGTWIESFFILPEYQNKGIGSYLLKNILNISDKEEQITRLKFLKNNPVKSLYIRHGFDIISSDEYFYSMERKPVTRMDINE